MAGNAHWQNFLRLKFRAIILESPGGQILWISRFHAYDHVAVPRPGVLTVEFAGPRRVIGMRMIPSQQVQSTLGCSAFGSAKIFRRNRKAIARRIVSPVDQRK